MLTAYIGCHLVLAACGYGAVNGNQNQNPAKRWALVVLPSTEKSAHGEWIKILESSPLTLTLAFSPLQMSQMRVYRGRLLELRKSGKIEAALRLDGDPPLPLIYGMNVIRSVLPADLPLPAAPVGWPEDVAHQIVKSRSDYRAFWNESPPGFLPGGGSLSFPVAEFLNQQKFSWVAAGFPKEEWPEGKTQILDSEGKRNESGLRVFAAHPLSDLLHGKESVAPAALLVKDLFDRLYSEVPEGTVPLILFDELRAKISLKDFLLECSKDQKNSSHLKMVTCQAASRSAIEDASATLQIWPYSWNWVQGIGSPSGPGLTAWVGDPQKNLAWDLLAQTRQAIEEYRNSGQADIQQFDRALGEIYSAESGDFFEWIADERRLNSKGRESARKQFEKKMLFKATLANVYRNLNVPVPDELGGSASLDVGAKSGKKGFSASRSAVTVEVSSDGVLWSENSLEVIPELGNEESLPALQHFSVRISSQGAEENILFQFSFRKSFSAPVFVDLYIDLNRRPGAGNTDLVRGEGAALSTSDGWEFLLSSEKVGP
ncbi:MAG: hypothetical protein HYY63_04050, partial [Elusimicrobia bacterium]|nr:hypothetical protein [Elusimicrobiota bacterium]